MERKEGIGFDSTIDKAVEKIFEGPFKEFIDKSNKTKTNKELLNINNDSFSTNKEFTNIIDSFLQMDLNGTTPVNLNEKKVKKKKKIQKKK